MCFPPEVLSCIRLARSGDFPAIGALNAAFVAVLSPMDRERLEQLHEQAALHRVIEQEGQVTAFLLALREGANDDGPNDRWFASRSPRFLHVDRVVVAGDSQARGAGTRLYRDAHSSALRNAVPVPRVRPCAAKSCLAAISRAPGIS